MFKIIRTAVLLSVFLFSAFTVFSNNDRIDSLQKAYDRSKSEKQKRDIQWQLGKAYIFVDPAKSIEISEDAFIYFKKKKDTITCLNILNSLGIANAIIGNYQPSEKAFLEKLRLSRAIGDSITAAGSLSSLANVYHSTSRFKKSIQYYKAALKIFKDANDLDGMANVYGNIGNAYKAEGNYQEALNSYFKALKFYEKMNLSTGTMLSNIGNAFADMDNHEKAKIYFQKSIDVNLKEGNEYYLAWGYSNLASVFMDEGSIEKSEEYYNKALAIHKEQGDQEGIAYANHAFGNIFQIKKKYDEAVEMYKLSIADFEVLGLHFDFAGVYEDWGLLELERKDTAAAAVLFEKAFREIDYYSYDFNLADLYKNMSVVTKWRKDYKRALKYHEMHTEIRDSVYKMETTRAFAEKEAKYQNEKKQKEIQELKHQKKLDDVKRGEEKERAALYQKFYFVGGLLLLIIVITLIRSNRMKQRNNSLLQARNDEISRQKEIIEEKNKDITASINYAQNIQQAILPDVSTAKQVLGDSFIFFMPRDIVSGDFYWMHAMENGDVFFAVADCTGHGVPGAFMSMMGNDMLNKIIVDHGVTEPGKILTELNREVKKALAKNISADRMNDGMDICLCRMNAGRNELLYASAMRAFYLANEKEVNEYKGDKQPIGGNTGVDFTFSTNKLPLQKNDCLYLTTDGFADQFGGTEGKKFMTKNLKELFISVSGKSTSDQHELLKNNFLKWRGNFEQIDDVTVMGVRV